MKKRILANILFLVSAAFLPWWLGLPVSLAALWLSPRSIEIIVWGAFYDALFSTRESPIFFYATVYATATYIVINFIQKRMK